MSSKIKVSLKGGGDRIAATTEVAGGKSLSPMITKPNDWAPWGENVVADTTKHYYVTPLNTGNIQQFRSRGYTVNTRYGVMNITSDAFVYKFGSSEHTTYYNLNQLNEVRGRANFHIAETTVIDSTSPGSKFSAINLYDNSVKTTLQNSWSFVGEQYNFSVLDCPTQHGGNCLHIAYTSETSLPPGGIPIMPLDDPYVLHRYSFFTRRNTEVDFQTTFNTYEHKKETYEEFIGAMSLFRGRITTPANKNMRYMVFSRKDMGFCCPNRAHNNVDRDYRHTYECFHIARVVNPNTNYVIRGRDTVNFGFVANSRDRTDRAIYYKGLPKYEEISYPRIAFVNAPNSNAPLHPNDAGMVRTYESDGSTVEYATYNGTKVPLVGRFVEGMVLPANRIYAVEQTNIFLRTDNRNAVERRKTERDTTTMYDLHVVRIGVIGRKLPDGRIELHPTVAALPTANQSDTLGGTPIVERTDIRMDYSNTSAVALNLSKAYPSFMPLIFDVTDHMHIFTKPNGVDQWLPHLRKFYIPMYPNKPDRLGNNVLIADPTRPEDMTIRSLPESDVLYLSTGGGSVTTVPSNGKLDLVATINGQHNLFLDISCSTKPNFNVRRQLFGYGQDGIKEYISGDRRILNIYNGNSSISMPEDILSAGDVIKVRVIVHKYNSEGVSSYFEKTLTANVTA